MNKLTMLLVSLLVLGFAVSACGEDEPADSGSGSTPAQTEESSGGASGGGDSEAAKAAQEGCEAGIKGNPAIDASKQEELSEECVKVGEAAASGDKEEFKEAYSSYCNKLAEALPEAGRDAAKDACLQGANAIN